VSTSTPTGLIPAVVSRPVAALMTALAIVVFGWVSYYRLSLTLMPDISYPSVTLRAEYPGAAPEEVETLVARPIEQSLGIVSGLVNLTTISRAETCDAVLEFEWNTPMAAATQEIREKLDTITLPREAKRPLILRYDPQLDPILRLALHGGGADLTVLRRLAEEEVRRDLETLPGVAAVKVRGGLEEEIRVELDESSLISLHLPIEEVHRRLGQENVNLAGGMLREGDTEYLVRTLNEFRSVEEIADLVVALRNGIEVRLRDVGRVSRVPRERTVVTRVDGADSVQIDIYREADANIVTVAQAVRERAFGAPSDPWTGWLNWNKPGAAGKAGPEDASRPLAERLPAGIALQVLADQSRFVQGALGQVRSAAIEGGLLAVGVLFLFLRKLRLTLIVGLSIPLSIVATFGLMHLFQVSLNVMSLGGLALGVGMMVDDAIVVLEVIDRRINQGETPERASVLGTQEVAAAVISATLTTVVVFLPIAFVEGVAGQIFRDQALTVVFALLASLAFSNLFVPVLTARRSRRGAATAEGGWRDWLAFPRFHRPVREAWVAWKARGGVGTALALGWLGLRLPVDLVLDLLRAILIAFVLGAAAVIVRAARVGITALEWLCSPFCWIVDQLLLGASTALPAAIRWCSRRRVLVVTACGLLLWFSWNLYGRLGTELMPRVRQGEFTVELAMPIGTPIDGTLAAAARMEQVLRDTPGIEGFATVVGSERDTNRPSDEGEHTARLAVFIERNPDRGATEDRVIESLRVRFKEIPGIASFHFSFPVLFTFRNPIEVEILGYDLATLRRLSGDVVARLSALPGLRDVRSTLTRGHPEMVIRYDRDKLAQRGLTPFQVAEAIRQKVAGAVATRLTEKDRRIEIVVSIRKEDAATVERVRDLVVNPASEVPIPLSAVAEVVQEEGPSEVRRIGHERAVVVSAQPSGIAVGDLIREIERALRTIPRPVGFSFAISGQNREMQVSLRSLNLALALAAFLVYVVMAAQFESLLHPLVIMLTLPLGFVGVVPVLFLLDIPLSIVVFLGMILLAGIVVDNAIVLLDYANLLRRDEGLEPLEAVCRASVVRLRPILMTTLTTVLGVLPMALGQGEGTELQVPMAVTIIAGQSVATLLTLVVIPVVYATVGRRGGW